MTVLLVIAATVAVVLAAGFVLIIGDAIREREWGLVALYGGAIVVSAVLVVGRTGVAV